ncbi:sulfurtransferase [Corynebacterium caspium]|uniref:sulfurtransferase n=1 Tax=Corynebacterium caspium TaxID=234828 RepID=UPI00037FB69E|nr:sulfurtransferase [Corynebacterium caspium]WKD59744.1 Putative thiosulfate sulfurtransferase SseA [Corynebacterium caspium DSM 44850]
MPVPFDPYPAFQDFSHPEKLVSPDWLSAHLGTPGLRVVESDEDSLLYDIGHIPGAVRIDWQRDLNDPIKRDFIDGTAFAKLMSDKGISRDDTVVIYGDQNNWWAMYTMWVFTLFGHPDVRILNGGRSGWMAEERDTSFVVPNYPPTDYPVVERDDLTHRVFVPEVAAASRSQSATIYDVRPFTYFSGEQRLTGTFSEKVATRHGHIPNAINDDWSKSVRVNGTLRTRKEMETITYRLDHDTPVITYCELGQRAAGAWFVLTYMLGFENVRLYDGSWAEWGTAVGMPIEVGSDI